MLPHMNPASLGRGEVANDRPLRLHGSEWLGEDAVRQVLGVLGAKAGC